MGDFASQLLPARAIRGVACVAVTVASLGLGRCDVSRTACTVCGGRFFARRMRWREHTHNVEEALLLVRLCDADNRTERVRCGIIIGLTATRGHHYRHIAQPFI